MWSFVSHLHFAINSGAFLRQLGARCSPVPAPFILHTVGKLGHTGCAALSLEEVSQHPGLCGQTTFLSLVPKELKRTGMLSH